VRQLGIPFFQGLLQLLAHDNQLLDFLFDLREFCFGDGANPLTRNASLIAHLQNGC